VQLRSLLAGEVQTSYPVWRASANQVLQARAFAAVQDTTGEAWLTARIRDLQIVADVVRVSSYEAGVKAVLDHKADAFFGERALLLEAGNHQVFSSDLLIVARLFTYEPLALATPRNDDDFRLLVDRVLSGLYASGGIRDIYTRSFGAPDEQMLAFLAWHTLPE
jgi:ABC-type amino acid transport substrate-binding protein